MSRLSGRGKRKLQIKNRKNIIFESDKWWVQNAERRKRKLEYCSKMKVEQVVKEEQTEMDEIIEQKEAQIRKLKNRKYRRV